MEFTNLHILIGWAGMFAGALSGAIIGLFFHKEGWAGGYASFQRRMMRLGHIAFFGIGFLNFMFAFSLGHLSLTYQSMFVASVGFYIAIFAMPLVCFLSAWRKSLRHLFFIPVLAVSAGVVSILMGAMS